MCLPAPILLAVGVGIRVAETVISLIGQNQARQARIGVDNANKDYNNYLADVADKQAGEVRVTSALQRRMITEGASRTSQKAATASRVLLGAQRAAAAGSGVGGGSVTTEALAIDEANKATLDDLYIRYEADVKKWMSERDEETQVLNLGRQAKAYRMRADVAGASADAADVAGKWDTASTLLSGAGQVAGIWYRGQREGVW